MSMLEEHEIITFEKRIKTGWIVGLISAGLTLLATFWSFTNEDLRYDYGVDIWAISDVVLILALSYGIYRKNRWAALGMLVYFILAKVSMFYSSGQIAGGIGAVIFGVFYLQATIACFKLHKHKLSTGEKTENRSKRKPIFYFGISVLLLFLLVFIALLVIGTISPNTEVIPGRQLDAKYIQFIESEELIGSEEEIIYWYSDAFIDYKEGFYFLTNKQVVLYSKYWEDPTINVPFHQIDSVYFYPDSSFWTDSYIVMYLNDSSLVEFPVSSEYGGDKKFFDRLVGLANLEDF